MTFFHLPPTLATVGYLQNPTDGQMVQTHLCHHHYHNHHYIITVLLRVGCYGRNTSD